MALAANLLYIFIALVSLIVVFFKRHLAHWKRLKIPHDPPVFPQGNLKGMMVNKAYRDIMKDHYDKFKNVGPFGGFFFMLSPTVIIYDLNLVRDILIKDFHNFTDRGTFHNERDDPLTGHLFALDGAKWKEMRHKLSPTFTSGKMKFMFPTVVEVGDHLLETFSKMIKTDPIIEVKDILARFTVDVIGTCAFGLDCNSLNDPNAKFRTMGARAFKENRHSKLVDGLIFSFPDLAAKLRVRMVHEEVHQFFMRAVRDTVEYREKNAIKRNDFMNLLIELKNSQDGLTIEQIAAQAFIFFFAGFETSSTTMGFALFELAINQDIQDQLRAEINAQFEKSDGKFTYESMAEMHYMEKVVKETLRKYSVVVTLIRKSLKEYPTSNPKFIIPKNTRILIPIDAIQRDPDIYPNPEQFDPERFSPEEIQKRHPTAWLAFGDGPRNCIGLRFGKMQTFIGLALLLRNYKFHYCDKTPNPLVMDPTNFLLGVKGGIYLRVERIK